MLKIVCWVNSEDYWRISEIIDGGNPIGSYGYMIEIAGESKGGKEDLLKEDLLKVAVVELKEVLVAVGVALPEGVLLNEDFELAFISQDRPTREVPVVCGLSPEDVRKSIFSASLSQRIEEVFTQLELAYTNKGIMFYPYDLRGGREEE